MAKKAKENKYLPIYILNGPNTNLLGDREPEIYGTTTLPQIAEMCATQAKSHGFATVSRQTNREGDLVDWIQEARKQASAIIINPAGYGHTSIAILDALLACTIPVIEVHLSNLARREKFRHHSWVSKGATGVIMGFGAQGYLRAIDAVAQNSQGPTSQSEEEMSKDGPKHPPGVDADAIRELSALLNETGLTEIEIEHNGGRIRVSRAAVNAVAATAPAPVMAPAAAAAGPAPGTVPSPMVGTVYVAAEPDRPAFITIGKSVKEGDTLFVIEAMKTMNPIAAPRDGVVKEICVSDKQPVEFGQALCVIG